MAVGGGLPRQSVVGLTGVGARVGVGHVIDDVVSCRDGGFGAVECPAVARRRDRGGGALQLHRDVHLHLSNAFHCHRLWAVCGQTVTFSPGSSVFQSDGHLYSPQVRKQQNKCATGGAGSRSTGPGPGLEVRKHVLAQMKPCRQVKVNY